MNFRVGQKVVCILRREWHDRIRDSQINPGPAYGDVCTITGIREGDDWVDLYLAEWPLAGSFEARQFRRIATTDISIFTAMLAPRPKAKAKERQHR